MKRFAIWLLALTLLVAAPQAFAQQGTSRADTSTVDDKRNGAPFHPVALEMLREDLENLKGQVTGIDEVQKEMVTNVEALRKIKVSGYIQAQYEYSDTTRLASNPYDAKDPVKGQFRLRRGRLKVTYDGGTTQYVLQGDFTNRGVVLKDAYAEFTEPWMKTFALRMGVFNRPVYEVEYSSSQRESPERSRVILALYPDERDLGAMLTVTPQKGTLSHFKLQVAAFNNTFQGTFKQASPNFNRPYVMPRLTGSFVLGPGVGLDLGMHARLGTVRANTNKVLESNVPTQGTPDSLSTKVGHNIGRSWFGVESQLYLDLLGGVKVLGEYITGQDVNELAAGGTKPIRKRDFNGFYVMLVKNVGTLNQFVAKVDQYTPNASIDEVKSDDKRELRQTTFGFGWLNYFFPNVRLMAYYEINKTQTVAPLLVKDPKDNRFTFRVQYKF